jgi:protocatechuate 3,4-dioxygenase beta subunit
VVALIGARPAWAAVQPTPSQTAGPFYPLNLPLDHDNDLVCVTGQPTAALGAVTHLTGQVFNLNGQAIAGATIEIWQCDAHGRYRHPGDSNPAVLDDGFQGYGQTVSADNGGYRFRTIKPVPYPGRTPHIHFAISGDGFETLVTQMYVAGEPLNERDGPYNGIDVGARGLVTVAFEPAPEIEADALKANFNIVLATGA